MEDLLKEEDEERVEEQEQDGEEEECFPSHGREEDPVTPCPTCPEVEGIDSRGTTQQAAAQPRGGDTEDSQGTAIPCWCAVPTACLEGSSLYPALSRQGGDASSAAPSSGGGAEEHAGASAGTLCQW